ncbi:hypothetical protein DEM34_07325 [Spiribacter halobius]|uniref:Uncharacterized protein n=1 Tax=Sediminicurvatus halobius TaxID=2182432 RepID=A0A2U2N383_9GAMM|nr:hypothetical protein DEM34_07325 [Spiribacter halobius]
MALLCLHWGSALHAFELPGCGPLEEWAGTLEPGETFALREAVEVTTLLRPEVVVPLTGAPADAWSRQDVAALRRQLNDCRGEVPGDQPARARQLYDAIKALDGARRPLVRMKQERGRIETTVERLLERRADERLPAQLALTQDVFRGEPAAPERYGLRGVPNWIRHVERARPYLTGAEVDALVARLETRRAALAAEAARVAAEREATLAALRAELAAVPEDESGLRRLDELQRSPRLNELPAEAGRAFRGEVQQRRRTVLAAVEAERQRRYAAERARAAEERAARERAARQAAEARAAQERAARAQAERARQQQAQAGRPGRPAGEQAPAAPADGGIAAHLAEVLAGDGPGTLTLVGLTPDTAQGEVLEHLRQRLGYEEMMSPFFTRAWGRGDAFVELRTMGDAVGQLDYTEYFRPALDTAAVAAALTERFGPPDAVESLRGSGRLMTWRRDGQGLQVFATDILHAAVRHQGYTGRISISLWDEAYDRHLAGVNRRCAELRDRPQDQWSMNDGQYFSANCPLMSNAERHAGVQVVE